MNKTEQTLRRSLNTVKSHTLTKSGARVKQALDHDPGDRGLHPVKNSWYWPMSVSNESGNSF